MNILWGIIIIAVGVFFLINASLKSTFIIFDILVRKSKVLWKAHVYRFYQISGVLMIVFGLIIMLGIL